MTIISHSIENNSTTSAAATANAGDTLTVVATALLISKANSSAAVGIRAVNSSAIVLQGDVFSLFSYGIEAIGTTRITIGATGSVYGATNALRFHAAGNTLVNHGDIFNSDENDAVLFDAGSNSVTNFGNIHGSWSALFFGGTGNVLVNQVTGFIETEGNSASTAYFAQSGTVVNRGTIVGDANAIYFGTTGSVTNSGTIGDEQSTYGVSMGAGAGSVVNSGLIQATNIAVELGTGNDSYNGTAGRVIGIVDGSDGNDTLIGGAQLDVLHGGSDNDTLTGNGGADSLDGGDGNDTYQLFNDTTDQIADGSGTDTILSTISRSLAGYSMIENLTLQGTAAINGTGNDLGNTIIGNGAKNTLIGGIGNDILDGGAGADPLNGGADNDTYVLGAESDTIIDSSGTQDVISSTINRSLAGYAMIENLYLVGTANIAGTGNGLANSLVGNSGNNVLKGGLGNDFLFGTIGTDSLFGEGGDDAFFYASFADSPTNATRDIIYGFDDDGNDYINLSVLPNVDTFANNIALAQAGANVLVTVVVGGVPQMQILLAGTTIGAGVGQVDQNDFFL
jgi:Ca2+-binding RTX toxin-like protein